MSKTNIEQKNNISFRINGEFITQLAREQCYLEGNYNYAIELLMSSMECNDISKEEILNMAIAILDGRAILKGTYPDDDYNFEYLKEKDIKWDLGTLISNSFKKHKDIQKEQNELLQKYCFIIQNLDEYDKKELNELYEEEYDEVLFENEPLPTTRDTILDNYIKCQMSDKKDNYGWLEPNGTYHPVDWGKHQEWALDYVTQHFTKEDYYIVNENCTLKNKFLGPGDYLAEKGWVLLHSPAQGIAIPTKSTFYDLTKAQKEFLYNYYIERDCEKEANEIWHE